MFVLPVVLVCLFMNTPVFITFVMLMFAAAFNAYVDHHIALDDVELPRYNPASNPF